MIVESSCYIIACFCVISSGRLVDGSSSLFRFRLPLADEDRAQVSMSLAISPSPFSDGSSPRAEIEILGSPETLSNVDVDFFGSSDRRQVASSIGTIG